MSHQVQSSSARSVETALDGTLHVGAAACDVTPSGPVPLYGYPNVPRVSSGVYDPLLASAFYLVRGADRVLFVSVDVIWLSKDLVSLARSRIASRSGLALSEVMITATHTHSGPATVEILSNALDPVVVPPDPAYLEFLTAKIVDVALESIRRAERAELTMVCAKCCEIGSNRHDPAGPTISSIPVIAAKSLESSGKRWIGLMYINPIHPTVLHEDSTLISGDFPGLCRRYLQNEFVGPDCPVLAHLGAAGNQSPRYVVRSNTFAEAERLGVTLGKAIASALALASFTSDVSPSCQTDLLVLPCRAMPSPEEAQAGLFAAERRLKELRDAHAEQGRVRTAECAVFGAAETACLAVAAADGRLRRAQDGCLPAEVQVIRLGDWALVGWPGEAFVEFALELASRHPKGFVITLANGELQGYVVTADAVRDGCYEALNAVFASPAAGEALVHASLALLATPPQVSRASTAATPADNVA